MCVWHLGFTSPRGTLEADSGLKFDLHMGRQGSLNFAAESLPWGLMVLPISFLVCQETKAEKSDNLLHLHDGYLRSCHGGCHCLAFSQPQI